MTLWNVKQVSEYLQVKPGTIRCWVCQGVIPIAKLGPGEKGCVRFERKEIDRWIKSCLRRERRITKRQERVENQRPLVSESKGHKKTVKNQ